MAVGDRVVFAFGMSCPLIVRPCDPGVLKHEYTMIGSSYIYDLRQIGKLETALGNGDLETIDIRLV